MNGLRPFAPTILVAALGTTFGSVLVIAPGVIARAQEGSPLGDGPALALFLRVVGWLFTAIALYVGAIVTANTCATVIAGQIRVIALQRVIGATGASIRRRITRTGLVVGVTGGLIGLVAGTGLAAVFVVVLRGSGFLPDRSYPLVPAELALPVVAVVLATWGAFAVGSRRVLGVTPLQALAADVETGTGGRRATAARLIGAFALIGVGAAIIALSLVLAPHTSVAALPAALGAFLSFAGVVVGAQVVMPPVLALIGRIGAHDPVVLLAGRNALREPARASRAVIGLVIGVTLLVTFSVALGILQDVSERLYGDDPSMSAEQLASSREYFAQVNTVIDVIVGFSAVIAAVGVVNALALGVAQRRRELGLLRVLGLTGAQVRRMIIVESVQMVVAAAATGLALGTFYGWLGGQTLLGQLGVAITPVLPLGTVTVVVVGAFLLAAVATVAPVRSAMRVPPTEALAVE